MSTAVILAGGYSSRMGMNKAELKINEKTLMEIQIDKVRAAGFDRILVSGYEASGNDVMSVPDIYPHKGPLSGIHAGLHASEDDSCLILCVDMPLLPVKVLEELKNRHQGGITLLCHNGWIEPTVGVYDRSLLPLCEPILQSENTSIRVLMKQVGYRECDLGLDERYLLNCNTPEEYRKICALYTELYPEIS